HRFQRLMVLYSILGCRRPDSVKGVIRAIKHTLESGLTADATKSQSLRTTKSMIYRLRLSWT
ncbi:hypothetical protein, partial [Pseudoalteromonas sp. SIMBA_162]|uniref:hypothetical protein n=1 Tax=Pseudoalteromonas sp. SIMBA_162 TaxID=3080867 RepID=UPI00397E2CB5